MKSKELYENILKEKLSKKSSIDVIHVNDNGSRFYGGRFSEDLVKMGQFYDAIAGFNYTTMTSQMFIDFFEKIELRQETVIILDNVINAKMFDAIQNIKVNAYKKAIGSNKISDKDTETHDKIRQMEVRVVYLLDELVWEGIAGRSHSVYECRLVEDLMRVSDTIVVPNVELQTALLDIGLVDDDHRDSVIILPITVSSTIYPVNANVFARTYSTKIEKPSVLIKGAVLSKNLCEFIVAKHKKYNITISSVAQLPDDVMLLLSNGNVKHIMHYTAPAVNGKNVMRTFTDERDGKYDFVIYSSSDMLYDLAIGDADAVFSIASGSCVFACVKDGWFEKDSHICCKTGTSFTPGASYNKIDDMLGKYSVTVNWNELYRTQRGFIENKISDKPAALARLFAVIVGKDMVEKRFTETEGTSSDAEGTK